MGFGAVWSLLHLFFFFLLASDIDPFSIFRSFSFRMLILNSLFHFFFRLFACWRWILIPFPSLVPSLFRILIPNSLFYFPFSIFRSSSFAPPNVEDRFHLFLLHSSSPSNVVSQLLIPLFCRPASVLPASTTLR